jgi:hypothetical protein
MIRTLISRARTHRSIRRIDTASLATAQARATSDACASVALESVVAEQTEAEREAEVWELAEALGLDHRRDRLYLETIRSTGVVPERPARPRHLAVAR